MKIQVTDDDCLTLGELIDALVELEKSGLVHENMRTSLIERPTRVVASGGVVCIEFVTLKERGLAERQDDELNY